MKKTHIIYIVTTMYSFDPDIPMHAFSTESEARKFLADDFANEVRIDRENGKAPKTEMLEDGSYAKIVNVTADGDEAVTEWFLTSVKAPAPTPEAIKKSEQVLIDNGIEPDEASVVLQALGYTLLDIELYN